DGLGVVRQEDRVVQALPHLGGAVDARQQATLRDQRLRDREDGPEKIVEPTSDLARQLDVRLLVAADRHEVALHHEDVGGLEDRIAEESVRRQRQIVVAHLFLERRNPLRPRNGNEHREIEEELGHFGDARLQVDRGPLRIDPEGEVVDDELADVLPDLLEVRDPRREHVVVGDQEEALVLVLEPDAVRERPVVVPEMEALRRRPVAREDALPRLLRGSVCGRDGGLGAHGRCDGTAKARASSSQTRRTASSRLPMKKCSASGTTARRASGSAARSSSAFPNWSSSAATTKVPAGTRGGGSGRCSGSRSGSATSTTASARPPRSSQAALIRAPTL